MTKTTAIVLGVFILLLASIAGGWLIHYWRGLRPILVIELPSKECPQLSFGRMKMARGPEVENICRQQGIQDKPLFALKGRKAVRFVPDRFHYVKGTLETSHADNEVVYFYWYNPRYKPIVQEP